MHVWATDALQAWKTEAGLYWVGADKVLGLYRIMNAGLGAAQMLSYNPIHLPTVDSLQTAA